MILVMLGTQDKSFERLLKQIEKEIENKNIKEQVIVQAGYTKFESKNMKIFDYVEQKALDDYIKKADLIICHAGVGTILNCLENKKKVIVVPRLSKYKEHNNDHQVQIAKEFSNSGYIKYLEDLKYLNKCLKNMKDFKSKELKHNNKIIKTIEEFIDSI